MNQRTKGGDARAKSLSPERRSEIAKKAAAARWAAETPKVISGSPDSPLTISGIEIECYVLDDGTRVLTQGSLLQALGRSRRLAGGGAAGLEDLPPILRAKAIQPFIPEDTIAAAMPVTFYLPNGVRASGYNAELLPALCEIYLSAREADALPYNQTQIASRAEILVRGLARVGIIALVDEATGYQDVRSKDALAKILEAFVAKELQPWVKTFPVDFYREMFRLRGLKFSPDSVKRPQYFGVLTNNVVYKRLAPGVLAEIKEQQAKDSKKGRLHQRLTPDAGHPKLREHLASVTSIMKLSDDWDDFLSKLDRVHPMPSTEATAPLWDDGDGGTGI